MRFTKVSIWRNVKYYVVAYIIVVAGAAVATGLQLLEGQFPEFHPLNRLAANLSGITIGTVIMVVGFIRDKRLTDAQAEANKQRKRAEIAEAAIGNAQMRAEAAVEQARLQTEQAQQRAQKAEAELARVRREYETIVLARIRRLEEFTGMTPPDEDNG